MMTQHSRGNDGMSLAVMCTPKTMEQQRGKTISNDMATRGDDDKRRMQMTYEGMIPQHSCGDDETMG